MNQAIHNQIVKFIWGIADDVLRDIYVRGKYRDVILPMTVIRRLDAVLEPTKEAVLAMKKKLDESGVVNQDQSLCHASGEAFYNSSPFMLKDLKNRAKVQQLKADFEAYLDGFSPNVQEILEKFKFRNQIPTLVEADVLGPLIEKYLKNDINLSYKPVFDEDGKEIFPALDNHSMGTIFEELIRLFNEENNEEAGEHFTPRDVVKLMADMVFLPVADKLESSTYLIYDGACGTGGMLSLAEERLQKLGEKKGKEISTHIYGQEVQPETYAIAKADLLLQGRGSEAVQIKFGSTLSNDAYISKEFDFMLSNPPYGKSWKTDLEKMGGKKELKDPRFVIEYADDPEYKMIPKSSDGQMLFLVNKLTKMKTNSKFGSRIAHVHNGSSLFTSDAGMSNIRRWIIENDWLEAIVELPENIFYNTGISTFVWLLTNKKPEFKRGKVQLINATKWYKPLDKNMGKKNCELSEEHIEKICSLICDFKETEESKIFENESFGYQKIVVERPLRLRCQFSKQKVESLRYVSGDEEARRAIFQEFGEAVYAGIGKLKKEVAEFLTEEDVKGEEQLKFGVTKKSLEKLFKQKNWEEDKAFLELSRKLFVEFGQEVYMDYNLFVQKIDRLNRDKKLGANATQLKKIARVMSEIDEKAEPVVKKQHKKKKPNPLIGFYEIEPNGKKAVVEYEPDTNLRDSEQVPLLEEGGIEAFFKREILPFLSDAWIDKGKTQIGYEVSFTKHFYKPVKMRTLEEIKRDIFALEKETEGLLENIMGGDK